MFIARVTQFSTRNQRCTPNTILHGHHNFILGFPLPNMTVVGLKTCKQAEALFPPVPE